MNVVQVDKHNLVFFKPTDGLKKDHGTYQSYKIIKNKCIFLQFD